MEDSLFMQSQHQQRKQYSLLGQCDEATIDPAFETGTALEPSNRFLVPGTF